MRMRSCVQLLLARGGYTRLRICCDGTVPYMDPAKACDDVTMRPSGLLCSIEHPLRERSNVPGRSLEFRVPRGQLYRTYAK